MQNRGEDELDQYWVGRALRVEKVYTEPGSVAGTTGRVRYDVGDCEIAVHWFQRDVSGGSERRTFKLWAADEEAADAGPVDGETYTFNSTELRLNQYTIGFSWSHSVGDAAAARSGGCAAEHRAQRASSRLARLVRPNYRNVSPIRHVSRGRHPLSSSTRS